MTWSLSLIIVLLYFLIVMQLYGHAMLLASDKQPAMVLFTHSPPGALPSVQHMYKRMPSTCSNKVDTCPPGTKQGQEYLADAGRKRTKKKLESQPMPKKRTRCIAKAIEVLATPPPTTPPPVVVKSLTNEKCQA